MNKKIILALFLLLVFSISFSGCTVAEEKNEGALTTDKTTTTVGPDGIKQTKKTCPFWDRDC
ncbi:MAG: hypothetical protein ABH986_01575 [archaeon]